MRHAQPPRHLRGRGVEAGGDLDGPNLDGAVAGGLGQRRQPGGIAHQRLDVALEGQVPLRWAEPERCERVVDGGLGRVRPAGPERAGDDRPRDPAGLPQRSYRVGQVTEAARGDDEVERPGPERQRGSVGLHGIEHATPAAQHLHGDVDADDPRRAGASCCPTRDARPCAEIEDARARQPDRRRGDERLGELGVERLRSGSPGFGGHVVRGPHVGGAHTSSRTPSTARASHQASSSS